MNANAINDAGQVRRFYTSTGVSHAFIIGPNGVGMTNLGALGGDSQRDMSGYHQPGSSIGYRLILTRLFSATNMNQQEIEACHQETPTVGELLAASDYSQP